MSEIDIFDALGEAVRVASGLATFRWDDRSTCTAIWEVRRHGEGVERMTMTEQALVSAPAGAMDHVMRWNERVLDREFAPVADAMTDYLWY